MARVRRHAGRRDRQPRQARGAPRAARGAAGRGARRLAEVLARRRPHVVEDGATFEENAVKKARAVAHATMMLTLADDSGLEVDALGGRPGRAQRALRARARDRRREQRGAPRARSTRWATRRRPSGFRGALPLRARAGRSVHAAAASRAVVEGACEGTITRTPRGSGGFGYDPLFVVDRHRQDDGRALRGREEPREPPRRARSRRCARCSKRCSQSAPRMAARVG